MRLSKFTLSLSIYVIISSIFMQQVWDTYKTIWGIKWLTLAFGISCLLIIAAILYQNIKSGLDTKKLVLTCALCAWGFIFAWRQPYFSEKAHVLEFGLIGWLAMRDLAKTEKHSLKGVLFASIFAAIIGYLGEGIQKFLPWRVFEIRDIITNVLSGILGVILFILK
ncbi:MAG: VanZ family protein [Candidatus Omnitrophota bacterium]